jgi:hypothetical protein
MMVILLIYPPITTKILHGTFLYITGHLSIIENLFLIRIMQVNFIESAHSTYKPLNYALEKRNVDDFSQPYQLQK